MVNTIGIIGAGQMGSGIAQVFARSGRQVWLYDIAQARLTGALTGIEANLARQAQKGDGDPAASKVILGRIRTTQDLADLAPVDFAVEAVTENEALKVAVFRQLDTTLQPAAILASNTSSISISRLAMVTTRPDKVIGMHFMHPVPVMRLVEVIRGRATSDETFAVTASMVALLQKEMVVSRDCPGFVVNRILIPMINEAVFVLYEGIASAEDIDKGMKLGTNQPLGPLALADFIGLDTVLAIAGVLYEGFSDPKYRPCPLLVKMVEAGCLGKKTGQGFYTY